MHDWYRWREYVAAQEMREERDKGRVMVFIYVLGFVAVLFATVVTTVLGTIYFALQ